jgi:Right handed beta helix region
VFARIWSLVGMASIAGGLVAGMVRPAMAQTSGDTVFWNSPTTFGNDHVTFNALGYGLDPANSGAANLAALNSLATACNASPSGCRIYVPSGLYVVAGSVTPFTTNVTIYGTAPSEVSVGGTVFLETSASATLFDFQNTAIVSDLVFGGGGVTALKFENPTALTYQSGIIRCTFSGQTGAAVIMENNAWYVIRDSVWNGAGVTSGSYVGLQISSPRVPDVDQGTITGNLFTTPAQAFAAIYWISGGGTRIVNNKILTSHLYTTGIYVDPAAGVRTADIFVTNNSLEGPGKYGVYLDSSHGDPTTAVNNFVISDNQFGGFAYAQVQTNSAQIGNVSITSNQFITPPAGSNPTIALAAVSGAYVADNLFDRATTVGIVSGIYVSGAATDVTIGQNAYRSIDHPIVGGSATTSVKGLTDSTFATLPTVVNGSMLYCSDCVVAASCTSGGTGAFAKRLNGAWVCN